MGLLKSLKRWFNRNEAYGQFTTVNRGSLYTTRDRMSDVNKPILKQINEDDQDAEPSEGLLDAELDAHTSARARADREAAIEHERRLRESQH